MSVHDIPGIDIDALRAEMEAAQHRQMAEEVTQRQNMLAFAAIICRCRPWFSWDEQAPAAAGCPVHGNIMVTLDGRVL